MPAGIVFAAAGDAHGPCASLELVELGERGLETGLVADDPGVALHHGLKRGLHGEWVLAIALERHQRLAHGTLDLRVRNLRRCLPNPGRGVLPPPATKPPKILR